MSPVSCSRLALVLRPSPLAHSPAPGAQAAYERWSLAYFTRPGNSVELRALTDKSALIAEAVARAPDACIFATGQTSFEWFTRRIKNQRTRNQKVRRSPLIHTGWLCADSCARRARRRGARVAGRSTGRKLCERFLWLSSRCSRPLYVSLYINGIVASETRTQLAGAAAGNFLTGVSCVSLFVLSKVSIIV